MAYNLITGSNLPEAWENCIRWLRENGEDIPTEYDKPGDPPSKDATVMLIVGDPFSEPRYHRGMICGIEDTVTYNEEVCSGLHNDWVDEKADNPRWRYSYWSRLFTYELPDGRLIDQMQYIVETLVKCEHSRRAQATIWKPWFDTTDEHCPCLQRIWARIVHDKLVFNVHMRSNDCYRAMPQNMLAFTELQRRVADELSSRLSRKITPGQYIHIVDSLHIYGSCLEQVDNFIKLCDSRPWEQHTYHTEDIQDILDEAQQKILDREGMVC
jgi:thymidylate synthase